MGQLGKLIRKLRKEELKISVRAFAKKIKVNETYITHIEHGRKLPSLSVMKKIANRLRAQYLLELYIAEKYPEVAEVYEALALQPQDVDD